MKSFSLPTIIIVGIVIALLSFGLGRYTGSAASTTVTTKTEETKDTNTKQNETITQTKKPDGTITTITTISTDTTATDKENVDTATKSVIKTATQKTNISLLAGTSTHNFLGPPAYGISINREVLGPITVGAFGLANGTLGLSVGITF